MAGSIITKTDYVSLQFPLKGLYPGVFESVEETEKVFDQVQTLAAFLDKTYVARHCKTPAASFMITDDFEKFMTSNTRALYGRQMWQGILFGVAVSFLVILLTSWSFMLSVFATFAVCTALVSVLGVISLLGWDVGIVESTLITVTAGFSVDYVVHLVTVYAHEHQDATSKDEDWGERLTAVVVQVGPSVFHAMTTSVLGALPLLTCVMLLLYKLGLFLVLVVGFSFLASHTVFLPLAVTWDQVQYNQKR